MLNPFGLLEFTCCVASRKVQTGYVELNFNSIKISQSAMAWILLYYLVLKPLKLLPVDKALTEKYEDADLRSRFSYFDVRQKLT